MPEENATVRVPEEDIRFRIAAARRMLFRGGADSQIGGHVSVRASQEDAFHITPYQYFDETLPNHVLKVGFDLKVREPGALPASPGINFHSDLYRARPDVNCIIHTHGRNATLLSTISKDLAAYQIYASLFHRDVAFFKDDPKATPDEEGAIMAERIGGKRAMLLSHHGVIHVGETLERTTIEALLFELAAGYHLAAAAVGGAPLDDETVETYRALYLRIDFRDQLWHSNYRRLRRSDPDLFEALRR